MVNNRLTLVSTLIATFLLSACSGGANVAEAPKSSGSERLAWKNESLELDRTNSLVSGMSSGGFSAQSVTVPLTLSLVASLTPPTVNGSLVYATDVKVSGTKIYVAYNTPGAGYGGAIDVIDALVPALPVLSSQVQDAAADYNQLLISGSSLYAAGAKDTLLVDSAIVNKYNLTSGNIGATPTNSAVIAGRAGLGLAADSTNIYAVGGNDGGLSILALSDLTLGTTSLLDGARDVRMRSGVPVVLTGKTNSADPALKTYAVNGTLTASSATMSNAVVDEAKATLQTGSLLNLATAGVGGTNLICSATGLVMNNIPIPAQAGLTPEQRASNAAVFANGLVYVANGGAGIYVYALEQIGAFASCNVNVSYVGKIAFNDGVSINNVMVSGGYLIAATGAGGFKIVLLNLGVTVGLQGVL